MNRLNLQGCLEGKETLRYTLGGLPILRLTLMYEGSVREAQAQRKLKFSASCVAIGDIAEKLDKEELGEILRVTGFLAPSSPRSTKLFVHITEYEKGV